MKKFIIGVLLFFALFISAFASGPIDYADGINDSSIFINAGAGFPLINILNAMDYVSSSGSYFSKTKIPSFSVSADFHLPIGLPVSAGAYYGITIYDEKDDNIWRNHGWYMGIGARISWHFNFKVKNLDPYAGGVIGLLIHNRNHELLATNEPEETTNYQIFCGGHIGIRYFFSNNIGIYLEAGFNQITVGSIGLSLKF